VDPGAGAEGSPGSLIKGDWTDAGFPGEIRETGSISCMSNGDVVIRIALW